MSVFSHQPSALTLPSAFAPLPPSPPPPKLLNVTVTILSMSGVHAKESCKRRTSWKSKKFSRGGKHETTWDESKVQPTTTLVATFEKSEQQQQRQPGGDDKTVLTHIPSLPLSLPPPPSSSSRSSCSSSATNIFNDVVHWPEQNVGTHSKISSFTFSRHFSQEAGNHNNKNGANARYVPQLCSIQISISRNNDGKMYRLGNAHVFVSGEEDGGASMNVPVVDFEKAFNSLQVISRGGGNESGGANLMRLKGDTLKIGLAARAMLRVLVRVSDPMMPRIQVSDPMMPRIQINYVLSSAEAEEKEQRQLEDAKLRDRIVEDDDGYDDDDGERTMQSHTTAASASLASLTVGSDTDGSSLGEGTSIGSRSYLARSRFQKYKFSKDEKYHDAASTTEDDASVSSESSSEEELMKLIRDLSDLSGNSSIGNVSASSSSVSRFILDDDKQQVGYGSDGLAYARVKGRADSDHSTACSSSATESTGNSANIGTSSSIASPPIVKRTTAYPQDRAGEDAIGSSGNSGGGPGSMISSWTRRLVCCASSIGGINIVGSSQQADKELLLASIDEDEINSMMESSLFTYDDANDQTYSLEGRNHSSGTLDTDDSPW